MVPGKPAVHRAGDSCRLDLGVFGNRALIHLVEGAVPEAEPSQEVTGGQRLPVMHGLMSTHRATSIEPGVEQDSLPKVAHDRKMRLEAVNPYLRERLGKDAVDKDPAVKAAQRRSCAVDAAQLRRSTASINENDMVDGSTTRKKLMMSGNHQGHI
ncbi:hypothetical protein ACRDU6_18345 [Mycolicibacterium sp. ELW1]|uniref:hypothetical protein n=1 Tax=Mycobacteriaceae TaxID=1762 RepID=UPI001AEFAF91|nr:hypothetical protein [Mycobacterium sp. ELW1]